MIILQSLFKSFATKQVLRGVDLQIKKGEIVGFLGVNGAGKTTTMRHILGLLRPTEGTVTVDNLDPIAQRMQVVEKIGYLPENNPLPLEMKPQEYLEFIADVKKVDRSVLPQLIQDVAITDVLQKPIEQLSRGYKQRVGLAAALIGEPEILILDEPTSGLDPIEQDRIKDLIKRISKEKLVIFSTHILSEVQDIASRVVIIHDGTIRYDGPKPKGTVDKLFKDIITGKQTEKPAKPTKSKPAKKTVTKPKKTTKK
ncbi:MAG: ABC transporter ATP-binding protein [Weeksellaceae bacterium]